MLLRLKDLKQGRGSPKSVCQNRFSAADRDDGAAPARA
jgi:hypothetical protein